MTALASIAVEAGIKVLLTEYTSFLARRQRAAQDAAWSPSGADVVAFANEVRANTPENLKAKIAAEEGVVWPPPEPVTIPEPPPATDATPVTGTD